MCWSNAKDDVHDPHLYAKRNSHCCCIRFVHGSLHHDMWRRRDDASHMEPSTRPAVEVQTSVNGVASQQGPYVEKRWESLPTRIRRSPPGSAFQPNLESIRESARRQYLEPTQLHPQAQAPRGPSPSWIYHVPRSDRKGTIIASLGCRQKLPSMFLVRGGASRAEPAIVVCFAFGVLPPSLPPT